MLIYVLILLSLQLRSFSVISDSINKKASYFNKTTEEILRNGKVNESDDERSVRKSTMKICTYSQSLTSCLKSNNIMNLTNTTANKLSATIKNEKIHVLLSDILVNRSLEKNESILLKVCHEFNIAKENCLCTVMELINQEFCRNRSLITEKIDTWTVKHFLIAVCNHYNVSTEDCYCPKVLQFLDANTGRMVCNMVKVGKDTEESTHKCDIGIYVKAITAFVICASIIGIFGNTLVLIVRSANCQKSIHYQILMGLATADLLFAVLKIITYTPQLVKCKWLYGIFLCKILNSFLGLSSFVDLGFIVIVAIERYVAIVYPLSDGLSSARVYILITINVFVSMLAVLPMMLVYDISNTGACSENWAKYPNGSLTYSWILLTAYFLLPVISTFILYYRCIQSLKQTLQRHGTLVSISDPSQIRLEKENKRIMVLLSTLLITFCLLTGPNRIAWLIIDYVGKHNMSEGTFHGIKIFAFVPYTLHISVNPIIYSVVDKNFRRKALKFLRSGTRNTRKFSTSSVVVNTSLRSNNITDTSAL